MRTLHVIASVLLIIGGLNWGLVALFEYDLVASIAGLDFGETNAFTRIIYGLVGLSAIVVAGTLTQVLSEENTRTRIR